MIKKTADWDSVFKEIENLQHEKKELVAQVAIMRDALIQSLYALESLKEEDSQEWNDLAERALTSVNWVLTSDAGHEFLESYVRMQKALLAMKAHEIIANLDIADGDKNLH